MFDLFNKPYLKVLFALILLFIVYNFISQGIWESYTRIGIDFDAYYHWEKYIGVYPPFWWIFMAPWRLLSYPVAKNLWITFNLLLLFLLSWNIYQWIKKEQNWAKHLTVWLIGLIIICVLYFYPLIVTLQTGQVNLLLLFLVSLSFWFYRKQSKLTTAILLGLAISLKPLPGLMLLYWFLKKEYRIVGYTVLTILILWLITIPIFGIQYQTQYFTGTFQFSESLFQNSQQLNNTSLYAFWNETGRTFLNNLWFGKLAYLISFAVLLIFWFITVYRNKSVTIFDYAWAISTPPLLFYYTEMHHFILSLMFYLVTIGYWFKISSPIVKTGIIISWILVNLGFQIGDVTTFSQTCYLYRYLSLFGILIGWIAGLIILNQKQKLTNEN
jgi:hypothetical protein